MAIRWLLLKDLQILRRSKLLVALLVLYPVAISLLIGIALSRTPDKPKVAFLNEVPPAASTLDFGDQSIDVSKYANEFFDAIEPVRVRTREEAIEKVRSGDALAALIIPSNIVDRLSSLVQPAEVEVVYNGDALKQSLVQNTIDAQLARANQRLAQTLTSVALGDLQLLLRGGELQLPFGGSVDLLGLERSERILRDAAGRLPEGSEERRQIEAVADFAGKARIGLSFAEPGLTTVTQPIKVDATVISGGSTTLDAFAVVLAVAVSLLFIGILLASGMLALEREEQAFGRLVRGLVSRSGLLAEKIGLSAACAALVALVMLCGIGAFTGVQWGRFPLWVVALAAGGLGCAALGVLLGALAREVRAASLLGLLLALPLAFLALIPSGAVAEGLYRVIQVINAIFPFDATLRALDGAVNDTGSVWGPAAHLVGLAVAYGILARQALRRFAP